MAVGLDDLAHPEAAAELEELLVLVRRVDEESLAAHAASHDEDVVVERPDDHLVNLHLRVLVVHESLLACLAGAGTRPRRAGDRSGDRVESVSEVVRRLLTSLPTPARVGCRG